MHHVRRSSLARPPRAVAKRQPITRIHHGDVFVDPYEWLRDKDNPEVISYLEAENAYTEAQTAHLSELSRRDLQRDQGPDQGDRPQRAELHLTSGRRCLLVLRSDRRRVGVSDLLPGCRRPIAQRCRILNKRSAAKRCCWTAIARPKGHEFFSLGAFSVSLDGRLLAYSVDLTGAERFTIMIKDLVSGELLADQIERHGLRGRMGEEQPPFLHQSG